MDKETKEQYLKMIFSLTEGKSSVKTTELAKAMNLTPATITEALQKLSAEGLIDYEAYKGSRLSPKGRALGRKISRKHRLLERFLYDILKLDGAKVHEQACKMEHTLSDEAEIALCRMLQHPDTCPDDGKSIPPCGLNIESCADCASIRSDDIRKLSFKGELKALTELGKGEKAKIQFIRGGQSAVARLHNMGLTKGAEVQVTNSAPFSGPIEICVRGCKIALGRGIASKIFVQKAA